MKLTAFGVAVIDGDRLSGEVIAAGRLDCQHDWLRRAREVIPVGGVVCDVGAALGDHTLTYAQSVGEMGKVYAIEPYAPFLECLRFNMAVYPQVRVVEAALSDRDTHGTMVRSDQQPNNHGMASLVESPSGGCRVTTLDALAKDWTRLDFVKIDVEGLEPKVLDGAQDTIRRFKPVLLVEVNDWALRQHGFTPQDVYRCLEALGYDYSPMRQGDVVPLNWPELDLFCTPKPVRSVQRSVSLPQVHLLTPPNTQTTREFFLDGFCQRTRLFASLLTRLGYPVILYGSEDNDAACDQFVSGCITKAEQAHALGTLAYQNAPYDGANILWTTYNARAAHELKARKRPGDWIAHIGGSAHGLVTEGHPDLLHLEYSIGYQGIAAGAHRVFQSHAWRHIVHGFTGIRMGREFDVVIPPWFDVADFPFVSRPDDYVLYCGRLVPSKGIVTVCESAKQAGVRLLVIGHGDPKLVTYGEYLGAVSNDERNRLMSHARAVMAPTQYIEPFGNVIAEAQLCGTPMITTDFGAFTESVEHGVSGFRCATVGEFAQAIDLAPGLDRTAIRARAERLYSTDAADRAYRSYFRRLACLRGEGAMDRSPDPEMVPFFSEVACLST